MQNSEAGFDIPQATSSEEGDGKVKIHLQRKPSAGRRRAGTLREPQEIDRAPGRANHRKLNR
jgi:hypothetical protein